MSENICFYENKCKKYFNKQCDLNNFCQKRFRLDFLYDNALLSNKQRRHMDLRLDSDNKDLEAFNTLFKIQKSIDSFVEKGENLYIYSSICGNGKTAWSIRLMQEYFDKIWYKSDLTCRGLYINIPKFLILLKESISEENSYISHIKNNVLNADLVIWDEVGSKAFTQFEHEHVLSLINSRIDSGKANIYTSNLLPQQIIEVLGERLYSRIINNSLKIQFFGQDKRGLQV